MKYLITYVYSYLNIDGEHTTYHYDIVDDVEKWVDESQDIEEPDWSLPLIRRTVVNGYFLINVLPVSEEFAKKWDGALHGM